MRSAARPIRLFEADTNDEVIMLCCWYAIDNNEQQSSFLTPHDSCNSRNFPGSRKKFESQSLTALVNIPSTDAIFVLFNYKYKLDHKDV